MKININLTNCLLITIIILLIFFNTNIKVNVYPTDNKPKFISNPFTPIYDTLDVNITIYNPTKAQTNGNPLETADGSIIDLKMLSKGDLRWCAASRNLLDRWGGPISYGDSIFIMSTDRNIRGWWKVHDTMHSRFTNYIDLLVPVNSVYGKWYNKKILIHKKV